VGKTKMPLASDCGGMFGDSFRIFIRASSVAAQGTVGLLPGCRIPVAPESLLMLPLLYRILGWIQQKRHSDQVECRPF
jgi:hypothetical protein